MTIPKTLPIFIKKRNSGGFFLRAYDLTYSNSIGGEHATTINGNGKNPGMADILAVAKKIGLNGAKAGKIANEIKECVFERLLEYI